MGRGPRKLACVSILRQQRNFHVWLALHYRAYSSGPELCIVRFMDFRPVTCFLSVQKKEKNNVKIGRSQFVRRPKVFLK
jgi:hypothetical protein